MAMLTVFKNAMLWAAVLLVAGCSGITPYDPPDDRENPAGRGLLSGADGAFVFYVNLDEDEVESVTVESKKEAGNVENKP